MDYRNKLISDIAARQCKRIAAKTIRFLKSETNGMQYGDDSGLKNLWDEVCIQVKGEESFLWEVYLEAIESIIRGMTESLDATMRICIWLQTQNGMEWDCEVEPGNDCPFDETDITQHILNEYVLCEANKFKNRRIEKFLEREERRD